MRALIYDGESTRLDSDRAEPSPAPGEALIKPTRLLLSPADSAPARSFRGVLGHQFVGVIKKLNVPADATAAVLARKAWTGKRVVASPTIACSTCDLCRAGLSAHCRARRVMGVHERDGCFADLFTAPLSSLYEVPASVSDDEAVFAHLLSGATHASNMLRSEGKSYITVLGDSALALLTAQVLAKKNTSVRLLSARADIARLCDRWQIKQRPLDDPGRRQDQDIVVDCTGSSAGLRLALQFIRPRGLILLKNPAALTPFPAGSPFNAPPTSYAHGIDLTPAIANEIHIVGSRDGPMPDALMLLKDKAVDVMSLVSKRMKFDDAAEAVRIAAVGEQLAIVLES